MQKGSEFEPDKLQNLRRNDGDDHAASGNWPMSLPAWHLPMRAETPLLAAARLAPGLRYQAVVPHSREHTPEGAIGFEFLTLD